MDVRNKPVAPKQPARRGRPLVDDKRRKVLDAALVMFADRGFHGTTMPDVAKASKVGTGTLYHYFEDKEQLVNEVFRDFKLQLRAALLDGLAEPDVDVPGSVEQYFRGLWIRFARFSETNPYAVRFLEMQDHADYLDAESRRIEASVLVPIFMVMKRVGDRAGFARPDHMFAMMWGCFVGLVKGHRLRYIQLDSKSLDEAGTWVWRMFAPEADKAARRKRG
jgi:AcrR family transcriptional regulator